VEQDFLLVRMPQIGVAFSPVFIDLANRAGFQEVFLPSIEPTEIYTDKAGPEVLGQMYTFTDKGGRDLCLRPEGTATCQLLAREDFKRNKDVKLWYETRCYRYERPQAGRYREFTQFGIEILNPRRDYQAELVELATTMVRLFDPEAEVDEGVSRGLAYYSAEGFEIRCPRLGAQRQVCGGGSYAEGIGFAIGLDRLVLAATEAGRL
jgi:histidyl-tRNA synthetase